MLRNSGSEVPAPTVELIVRLRAHGNERENGTTEMDEVEREDKSVSSSRKARAGSADKGWSAG